MVVLVPLTYPSAPWRTISLLCPLLCYGSAAFAAPQQRIPRQGRPTTAAVQGIVRNQTGLGLGGVSITLHNFSTGENLLAVTTGDGAFRFVDLHPGPYQLRAVLDRFEPFERSDIQAGVGEIFTVEATLKAIPAVLPPPKPPAAPGPPYRDLIEPKALPVEPSPQEALPPEGLPPDDRVFTPLKDRWKYDWPEYHRYGPQGESPYVKGHWYDPFNRNKIKGDYPILGKRTFLNITLTSDTAIEGRLLPTPSNLGTANPGSTGFFGQMGQFATSENLGFSFDLFHGDTSFRPADWRIKITPEINVNYLLVQENGIVSPDVRAGTTRLDAHLGLQEAFAEVKLKDLSNAYDFVSARAGIQTFNSDFRGFIFFDQEPGVRIFGNLGSNRYQYNAAYFAMLEKDTNSGLNSFSYRHQQVLIGNLYRQDFFKPGYTMQVSFHYNKDDPSFQFDTNNFLVRPAPIGLIALHRVEAYYYGLTGDGHLGRININHAFYQVLGHDSSNPIAGRPVDINAQMAAVELSLDKDWIRFRIAGFFASGDKNPRDGTARGFDSILDDSNFAGGFFSFWNREGIRLLGSGVGLVSPGSLLPSLRSSKTEGQANFVNPGLILYNAGADVDITPKLRGFLNLNFIRFVHTDPIELLLFQNHIHDGVGADSGLGFTYRPPLSENITLTGVFNAFQPFQGFKDIYTGRTLFAVAANVRFRF